MLLDSTFLIHLEKEVRARQRDADTPPGPALRFLARHAGRQFSISPICAGLLEINAKLLTSMRIDPTRRCLSAALALSRATHFFHTSPTPSLNQRVLTTFCCV